MCSCPLVLGSKPPAPTSTHTEPPAHPQAITYTQPSTHKPSPTQNHPPTKQDPRKTTHPHSSSTHLVVAASHVFDALHRTLEPVVHAHGSAQAGQVPAASPVAAAMVASAQGAVLLHNVKVAAGERRGGGVGEGVRGRGVEE